MTSRVVLVETLQEAESLIEGINRVFGFPDNNGTTTYTGVASFASGFMFRVESDAVNYIPSSIWGVGQEDAPPEYEEYTGTIYEQTVSVENNLSDSVLGSIIFGKEDFVLGQPGVENLVLGDGLDNKWQVTLASSVVTYGTETLAYHILV